jgi:hypothetical protein
VDQERLIAAEAAVKHDITVLDDRVAIIDGVRFVGATLWTDFCLGGEDLQQLNMHAARTRMNDYHAISLQMKPWARFTPDASLALHKRSRAFIWEALEQPFDGPTVVVTHHGPHPGSVHTRFDRSDVNPAYVSDLTEMIARFQPPLWLHGHVHNSFDYRVANTRIVCNPRGYGTENAMFDPGLLVEV